MEISDSSYLFYILASPFALALFIAFFRRRPLMLLMVNIFLPYILSLAVNNLMVVGAAEIILFAATILLILTNTAVGWRGGSTKSKLTFFFVAWVFAVLLSACLGFYMKNDREYLASDTFKFLYPVIMFWLSLYMIKDAEDARKMYWSILFMIGAICFIDMFFFIKAVGEVGSGIFAMGYRGPSHSLSGVGIVMAVAILPEVKEKKKLLLLLVLYLIMFAVALFRTGYFALFIAFFAMMLLIMRDSRSWRKYLPAAVILPVVLAVFVVVLNVFSSYLGTDMGENIVNRLDSISDFADSTGGKVRLSEITAVREQILPEYPVLGLGMGGTFIALDDREGRFTVGRVVDVRVSRKHYIHNNLFEILARTGLAGAAIYISLLLFFFFELIKSFLTQKDSYKRHMLLGIVGFFCASLVMSGNGPAMNSTLLMLVMAMASRLKADNGEATCEEAGAFGHNRQLQY